ncbi:MAG TPA: hypothetical protein VFN26_20155 [Candidatus Acidoferrum sp.]|nr:hypothetical protein [Candidatus Acidoferrum sp.]
MKSSPLWRILAACVLLFAFGMAVYRAKTQTIAHDEALEYEWFLDGGVAHVLEYNPANHMLFTLLAKPTVWTLGVSELRLRLPSVAGALLYVLAAYLLSRRLFGGGLLFFLSVGLLCLNPQILEFMPAARGYILGLAGLVAAMYAMTRLTERGEFDPAAKEWRHGCAVASLALAVPVMATPTNAIPVVCLGMAFSIVALGGWKRLPAFRDARMQEFAKRFVAPGAAAGFCVLWPYLIQMRPGHFYAGLKTARDSMSDVFTGSFLYKWTDDVWAPSLGGVPAVPGSWQARAVNLGIYVLLPVLFWLVASGVLLARRSGKGPSASPTSAACRIFGGAAIACVLLIAGMHVLLRAHYPNARYCLFLVPLFTVGALLAGREIAARYPRRALRAIGLLITATVVADYAASIQVKEFRYNAYDAISFKLYQAIAEDAQNHGLPQVRVGGTWWYEPEINFYRRKFKNARIAEYDVVDKSYFWRSPNALEPSQYDYFVFVPASDPGLGGERVVFRDELRKLTVIAKK